MIKLSRPIVFFDLETTGVDLFNDRIVQIGAVKINPDGTKEEWNQLVNPQMPIPGVVTDIHGITDEMVKNEPTLGDLTEKLSSFFDEVDLGGYNIKNFDVPVLMAEFNRIGLALDLEGVKYADSMAIFRVKEPRTLTAAYQKYCGKELVDAHDAIADIRATVDVFEGQYKFYDDLPESLSDLHEMCFPADPDAYDAEGKLKFVGGKISINFGKHKGQALQHLAATNPGYLEWILKGSFSDKVKTAVKEHLK
jgi:DNA polymerase III subunit epsilon